MSRDSANDLMLHKAKILIVDDDVFFRGLLRRILEHDGYRNICTLEDPTEAITAHRDSAFDLILLDLHMPQLSGTDVLQAIRNDSNQKPVAIIVLTGDEEPEARYDALEKGADDFLVKPPHKIEILSRIRNLLTTQHHFKQSQLQQQKYQQFIENILPRAILRGMQTGGSTYVEELGDASILFADLVGFSAVCARLDASIVVENLNRIFLAFDQLCDEHGVEKIKTIGDAYMVTGSLDASDPGQFDRMATFAIAMIDRLASLQNDLVYPFQLRVGIERGALIAGILKGRRSVFDVWGDTVNAANRLQAASSPGCITVSRHFANALTDKFRLENRGDLMLKGVGSTEALFLSAR